MIVSGSAELGMTADHRVASAAAKGAGAAFSSFNNVSAWLRTGSSSGDAELVARHYDQILIRDRRPGLPLVQAFPMRSANACTVDAVITVVNSHRGRLLRRHPDGWTSNATRT